MKQLYFLLIGIPIILTQCITTSNEEHSHQDSSSSIEASSDISNYSSEDESSWASDLQESSSTESPQESSEESSTGYLSSENLSSEIDSSTEYFSSEESSEESSATYSSESVATDEKIPITIEVFTERGGSYGTYTMQSEGEWYLGKTESLLKKTATVKPSEQPELYPATAPIAPPEENLDPMPLTLTIIASSPGYFTTIYYMNEYEAITIDLDRWEGKYTDNDNGSHYAGVTIAQANWSSRYCYGKELYLEASFDNGAKDTIQSDTLGRYQFNSIDALDSLKILGETYPDFWMKPFYLNATIFPNANEYKDIRFNEDMPMADAPYIYLYPETTQDIEVSMTFNRNASILKSIPTYNTGWKVRATPQGRLDDTFDFLFYDFATDKRPDRLEGWLVSFNEYPTKIPHILESLHLNKTEIQDFMSFWTPYFDKQSNTPYFALYMEDLNAYNTLNISPTPDALLRVFLYVELVDTYREIDKPLIHPFERTGFTAVEWGLYSYNSVFNVDRTE
ncbi:MAG: hypothetical protein OCC49_00765 [Fibrobacterales bacterium]